MDPLQDRSYLLSVVEIIAESVHDSSSAPIHSRLDAYATFVNRVRSHRQSLDACDTLLPALVPLTAHKDNFIRALRRDIRLAHFDPFSHYRSSWDETRSIKTDTRQHVRDSSSLCHHALCAATTIFRFPAFHLVFPEHDLSSLFSDVLDVALAVQLPVLNEAKTHSLSLWALGCHRLPLTVLDSLRDVLFSALQRSLHSASQLNDTVLDGLKAVSHALERYPSASIELLSPLLPDVMKNLICRSSEHRLHASIALGKFANALIHQSELPLTKWQSISIHVTSFLESYCDDSQVAPGDMTLSCMVRNAFSADSHTCHADNPARILAVLASLIVLCGPNLYRKPTVLHFVLQSLAMALTHKRSIVRALHPHVWRCFIWTFGQMLFSSERIDPTLISSAFYVIKQEVSGSIGVTLASVLLSDRISEIRSDEHSDRVSQALSVIKAMVRTECKHTRREGFMFLQALTSDTQARRRILQNMYETPTSVLLDGTITRAGWDSLPSIIRSIPKLSISVRWPGDSEIVRHYKTLLVIWKHFASKMDGKHLDSDLIDVWLSILVACAHQLQYGQHPATITDTLKYIAVIIVESLPSSALGDCQPDWGSWDIHDQLTNLTFVDQLWSAMRRAFISFGLAEVAEFILASILQYAFHVLDIGVRTLWGKLCANLMTIASPSFLCDSVPPAIKLVICNQRELWGAVASSLSSSDLSLDWMEIVQFLAIPVCTWALSAPELEAWEALLRDAVTASGDPAVVINSIILQHFQGKQVETWESITAVLGFLLTCTHENGNFPINELLDTVDVCLVVCYNRAHHSSEVTHSLKLLDGICRVIASAPGNVMDILRSLRNSLCLWIEDHTEVMSDDQFNAVAVTLYCEALKALQVLPLSVQSLQDTEHFLASAFSRIPAPAVAPFAFEQFWRATYHGKTQFCNNLPPKIKSCLSCFVTAYGGDIAGGMSLTTESQSQSISNESQVHSLVVHQRQDVDEFGLCVNPSSAFIQWADRQHMVTSRDDTTILMLTPDDVAAQSTVLRQPHEYTNLIDASSADESEQSTSSPVTSLSPIFPPNRPPMQKFRSTEIPSHTSSPKRKFADGDDGPQKRSRISRSILRFMRKLDSEPATRDITPVDVPRMISVPLRKRMVFDGVEVPTYREVLRRRMAQRTETRKNTISTARVPVPRTLSPRNARRESRAPQSVLSPSEEDDFDWENLRVDEMSSEADVDRSLCDAYSSSPLLIQVSSPHRSDACLRGMSPQKASSQIESPPSASARLSLQRAKTKTTSSRLDVLRDVYSSVEKDGSQLPLPELMQATTLVHQIGAALSAKMKKRLEKMEKKTDGST